MEDRRTRIAFGVSLAIIVSFSVAAAVYPRLVLGPEVPTPPGACMFGGLCRALFGSPTPTSTPSTEPSDDGTRVLFLGDMMFDRTVATRMKTSKNPRYPFLKLSESSQPIFDGYDLVVANLEGPVAPRAAPVKAIDFAFAPEIATLLVDVGIDAVSQANNHTLDQGHVGAERSRTALSAAGLTVFGDQVNDDATSSRAVIEHLGQKIAVLGFNTTDNPLDEIAALDAIRAARQEASRVVVFMHWGEEYQARPGKSTVTRAHWFIDQGVDAVIGAHPHWMQSVEVYRGRPIAYSLGNFIFDQDWSAETGFGLAVGLTFSRNTVRGSPITSIALHPIKIELSQPRVLEGVERDARLTQLAEISDPTLTTQILSGVIQLSP